MQVYTDCCEDPVIHERINYEMDLWVEKKAPGVRRSLGCPIKQFDYIPSLRKKQKAIYILHFFWTLKKLKFE